MTKPNICIVVFNYIHKDPRVYRQILALKGAYHISTVGLSPSGISEIDDIIIDHQPSIHYTQKILRFLLLISHQYNKFYWGHTLVKSSIRCINDKKFDLVIANDIETLPLAILIASKNGAKIIFDAHEYAPHELDNRLFWKLFTGPYVTYLCNKYIPLADIMVTVSNGIANKYTSTFKKKCTVIHNCPQYQPSAFSQTDSKKIKIIHHGAASPERNIDSLIKMMSDLDDRYELHLMLVPANVYYYAQLQRLARQTAPSRIFFCNPVQMPQIVETLEQYDIGAYLLIPANFNNANALPNKFFEFMMAGLAIAIGPSPEMAAIIENHGCGIVSNDFSPDAMAKLLNSLSSEQIDGMKRQSLQAAKIFNSENECAKLKKLVKDTIEPTCAE